MQDLSLSKPQFADTAFAKMLFSIPDTHLHYPWRRVSGLSRRAGQRGGGRFRPFGIPPGFVYLATEVYGVRADEMAFVRIVCVADRGGGSAKSLICRILR